MIFYIFFIAGVIGLIIFSSSIFKVSKDGSGTHVDAPEYPERTYRIVPNEKGKFDVQEYVYFAHTDHIQYLWHSSSTTNYKDSLDRPRVHHPENVSLEEAKEYIAKRQIEDDKRLDEIEASKAHIAAHDPVVYPPNTSPSPARPKATPEEATTLASAFPDMGIDIDQINEMVRNRANAIKADIKPAKLPKMKGGRWPGLGKSRKFRKYDE